MKLTPMRVQMLYVTLTDFPPFNQYKWPRLEDIKFQVSRSNRLMGSYDRDHYHELMVSEKLCKTLSELLETICHEMCHMQLEFQGNEFADEHTGAMWNSIAAPVCDAFGFDFKTF